MWDAGYQNPLSFENEDNSEEDLQNEFFDKMAEEKYKYCCKLASIFGSDQGKEILKQWRSDTIEKSAWSPSLVKSVGLEGANAHAYAREGQNAFVRSIEEAIEIAHNCKSIEDFYDVYVKTTSAI